MKRIIVLFPLLLTALLLSNGQESDLIIKRSGFVSERNSCLSDLDFDGYDKAQKSAKNMAIVAGIGAGITAIGIPVWFVNSSKVNSYKNILLSRGIEASITPFTDYCLQLDTPYSGFTLTFKF